MSRHGVCAPRGARHARPRRQGGFSLVGAVFILVVLATAGGFLLDITGVQRETTNLILLQARAERAARAGLEWGVRRILLAPGSCPVASFSLAESTLAGFDVAVTCTSSDHVETGTTTTIYRLQAKAERGSFGQRDYVSRTLAATLTD